jgi:hypothetical protein
MIDLQLKKARLDQAHPEEKPTQPGTGHMLSRNELLDRIIGANNQKTQKE